MWTDSSAGRHLMRMAPHYLSMLGRPEHQHQHQPTPMVMSHRPRRGDAGTEVTEEKA